MKEEAILKINKIGKVSSVFALICKIAVGTALAFMLVCTIAMFVVPKDLAQMTLNSKVDCVIDLSSVDMELSEEDQREVLESLADEDDIEMEDGTFTSNVTKDTINLEGEAEVGTYNLRSLAGMLCVGDLNLIMLMVSICFGGALCKAFRDCQSPFEENVIKKMKCFAYSLIPWALFSTINQSVSDSLGNNKLSITLGVDLGIVLIALVVFLLVRIFEYGAVLQQESDETL